MEIVEIVVAQTHDQVDNLVVVDLIGKKLPYAFLVNINCHGYGKFKIDQRSLKAFEEKLGVKFAL